MVTSQVVSKDNMQIITVNRKSQRYVLGHAFEPAAAAPAPAFVPRNEMEAIFGETDSDLEEGAL